MTKIAFLACAAAASTLAQVNITDDRQGKINVEIDGKPFTVFHIGQETEKPFLHPLRSASGKIVSRVWPMEEKEGEAKDHPHHKGLWFTHGDVNGLDFWANEASQRSPKKGRVVLERVGAAKGGKKSGTIGATFGWLDSENKKILNETRMMTFYADPKNRMIDFDVSFTAMQKVKFGDTKEGFFAIRLTAPLDGKHSGKMVSAEGKTGEKQVWGKRSPWVDYSGQLEGETLGVAIFDHPGNPKHPTYWHSRDYGLFAANVFGEHDFYNDKKRDGGMTLDPGKKLRFRYRVVIHPGDTEAAGIAGMYKEWSEKTDKK